MSKVYLVGSGIGSLNNLTIRGKELIETADFIIYDSLIPEDVLSLAKNSCDKIFVGKRKGNHSSSQEEINQLLLNLAQSDKRIVRLKGGDPLLFSRGGEEIEFLNRNNISYEIIPGISSVQALQALLEIPLTHRNFNHSIQILTGHDLSLLNFKNLADYNGNIIILMGVSNLDKICFNLINAGKDSSTPVALISDLNNKPIGFELGTLKSFSKKKTYSKLPGIILIGDILSHLENFQQNKPKILITRPKRNYDFLSDKIEELGFKAEKVPLIKIIESKSGVENLTDKLEKIKDYDYLIFTSPTSVDIFFKLLKIKKIDIRELSNIKICSIGPGTDKALNNYCVASDLIPNEYSSDGIVKMLKPILNKQDKVLVPRSNTAEKKIKDRLKSLADVDEIGIYDIKEEDPNLNSIIKNEGIKYITATSATIAKNLSSLLNEENKKKVKVYSIGKETTKHLSGFSNIIESKKFSIDGLIETIKEDAITNKITKE